MALILDNSDILQACATSLAGVLIFLTIERKLDIVDIENKIANLERNLEFESKTILELKRDALKPGLALVPDSMKSLDAEITKHSEKIRELSRMLQEEREKRHLGRLQYKLKNREDNFTFLTLFFLTSCIVFLILVENQWTYYFINYSNVSRALFSLGLIFLLIRVAYRAIDLPPRR